MDKRKIIKIPVDKKSFFEYYLTFTKPLHKLSPKEISFLKEVLYKYHLEKDNFKKDEDLWKKVFDYDSKLEYAETLKVKQYSILNLMTSLRNKKIIVDNKINKNYLVDVNSFDNFLLTFKFTWTTN